MNKLRLYKGSLGNLAKIFFGVVCAVLWVGEGDAEIFRVDKYDESDGLPGGTVYSVSQDSDGFIWIGTSSGLCCFDGYSFRKYKIPGISRRPTKIVTSIYPMDNGNLLVGTSQFGLVVFDRMRERFYFLGSDREADGRGGPLRISSIEKGRNGEFLIGTIGDGIYVYKPLYDSFLNLEDVLGIDLRLAGVRIRSVQMDSNGNYYVATTGSGFAFIDGRSGKLHWVLESECGDTIKRVFDICVSSDGGVWVGTDRGLCQFFPKDKKLKCFPLGEGFLNPRAWVMSIQEKGENLYLAVRNVGMLMFNKREKKFYRPEYVFARGVREVPRRVNEIFIDRDQNIWVATSALYVLSPLGAFHNILFGRVLGKNIGVNDIEVVKEENGENTIWIGTDSGLVKYDCLTGKARVLSLPMWEGSCSPRVYSLFIDRRGRLWVGTRECLGYLVLPDEKFVTVLTSSWSNGPSKKLFVYDITEDRDGSMWAVTMGSGLFKIASEGDQIVRFDMAKYSVSNYLSCVEVDSQGNLWIGTLKDGLVKFREDEGIIEKCNVNTPLKLMGNHVTDVFVDAEGNVWVGVFLCGVSKILTTGGIVHYTMEDGLISNRVVGIISDNADVIWVSTVKGLSRIDVEAGSIVNFGYADGVKFFLSGGKYFRVKGGVDVSGDGTLWFGGPAGITFFSPGDVARLSREVDLKISLVEVIDKKGRRRSFFPVNDTLEFSYGDIYVKLDLTALDFYDPLRCRYRYRVAKSGGSWVNLGSARSMVFSGLSPGNHIVEVSCSNHKGVWSREAKKILLKVTPPFYYTWYFRIILVAFVVLAVVASIRVRVAAVRAQNLKLDKIVRERTRELERKSEELLQAHAELEKKVCERTWQLQELNKKLIREVEERKTSEDLLRESRNITRSLLDAISDSVVMVDTKGNIVALNGAMANRIGKGERELVGRSIFDFEFFDLTAAHFVKEVVEKKERKVVEREFHGRYYQQYFYPIFDFDGKVNRVVIFSRDVTDLKRAEVVLLKHKVALEEEVKKRTAELEKINRELRQEISRREKAESELRESEERFRYLIENANDIIWMTDTKGRFLVVNKTFEDILGYRKDRIVGETEIGFVKEDFREVLRKKFSDALKGETSECEIVVLTKKKEEVILWIKMVPFRDEGKVTGVFGIGRDITRLKRSEEELRIAEARKRESMKEFTLKLAHELKNPLASIKSSAQIVRSVGRKREDEKILKHMEIISRNVDICNRAIKELYDFTHSPGYNFRVISVKSLIDKLSGEVERINDMNGNVRADLRVECGDCKLVGDEIRLFQAFQNIVSNAVESIIGEGKVEIVINSGEDYVEFKFIDTGCGISHADLDKIFKPFYSSKATGFGLGLAIVKDVVEMHGGTLSVESEEGRGSVFSIVLPIAGVVET